MFHSQTFNNNFFNKTILISFLSLMHFVQADTYIDNAPPAMNSNQGMEVTPEFMTELPHSMETKMMDDSYSPMPPEDNHPAISMMGHASYDAGAGKFTVDANNIPVPKDSAHYMGGLVVSGNSFITNAASGQKTITILDPDTVDAYFRDGTMKASSGSNRLESGDQIITRHIDNKNDELRRFSPVYVLNR